MLSTRLAIGLSMVGVLVAVLCLDEWLAPWFPFWLAVVAVVMGAASLELVELLKQTGLQPSGNTAFAGVMALVLANWAPHVARCLVEPTIPRGTEGCYDPLGPVASLGWPMLGFGMVVMATFVVQSVQFEKPGATMATISSTLMAITYVGLLGTFVIQLRWFEGRYHGVLPLVYLVAAAKGADTGAYTVGRIAGRTKLWPKVSPKKTVEGAIGGLFAAAGAALIVEWVVRTLFHAPTIDRPHAIIFGVVVGIAAELGDLMESMIKRDCSRKDASDSVPGFGGVLDVIDSLLFAGPVAFGYWLWVGL